MHDLSLIPNADLLRRIMDSMYVFAGLLDSQGRLIEVNRTVLASSGVSVEEVMGHPFGDTKWWSHSPEVQARIHKAIADAQQGKHSRFDVVADMGGGYFATIDFSLSPVRDENGQVLYLFPMGSDVTQERKTRRELEESQEYLRFATESAEVGIWSLALPSGVLTWSNFHKQMWGYDYHGSLYYEDWHRVIHSDDVQAAFGEVEKALQTRSIYQAEYRIKRADTGEERWMRSVGQYFFDRVTDQPYKLTGVTYDITARKTAEMEMFKSQQRLVTVLDNLPDGFMIFDAIRNEQNEIMDFEWTYSNAASTLIVGHPPEELIGKRLLVEMPGNKEAGLFDAYVQVVETGQTWVNEFAYPYEGINKHFISRAVKVGDGFGVMFSDVTLRKEFEVQLTRKVDERTAELQIKNQQLEQYAFITSHDLQEPLRKIEMFADMLTARSRAHLPDTGKHHLDKIVNAAGRMRALIDALLKFSRMSTQINEEKPVNLNTIVSDALNMLELRIHEKRAQFEVADLPVVIGTDSLLDILFSNLIANSLKFSKDDTPPQVRIRSRRLQPQEVQERRLDTQRHYALISIEDNGLGFEQEFGERIFEMFRRLHKDIQGTGIGLAMCAKIVQLHGGSIKAFGTPEVGAKFEVVLPLA